MIDLGGPKLCYISFLCYIFELCCCRDSSDSSETTRSATKNNSSSCNRVHIEDNSNTQLNHTVGSDRIFQRTDDLRLKLGVLGALTEGGIELANHGGTTY